MLPDFSRDSLVTLVSLHRCIAYMKRSAISMQILFLVCLLRGCFPSPSICHWIDSASSPCSARKESARLFIEYLSIHPLVSANSFTLSAMLSKLSKNIFSLLA